LFSCHGLTLFFSRCAAPFPAQSAQRCAVAPRVRLGVAPSSGADQTVVGYKRAQSIALLGCYLVWVARPVGALLLTLLPTRLPENAGGYVGRYHGWCRGLRRSAHRSNRQHISARCARIRSVVQPVCPS